jgi:hypothetical protein
MNSLVQSQLRVKIKSLASESRAIKHEIKRRCNRDVAAMASLSSHLDNIVRPEIRATLWFYAFLRGRELHQLERSSRSDEYVYFSTYRRSQRMLVKFMEGSSELPALTERLKNWYEDFRVVNNPKDATA